MNRLNLNLAIPVMLIAMLMLSTGMKAAGGPDTVTIQIGGSKMIFVVDDNDDLQNLRDYDINQIVDQFETLLDSAGEDGGTIMVKSDDDSEDLTFLEIQTGEGIRIAKESKRYKRTSHEMHLEFGLNNYLEDGKSVNTEPYRLSNLGSRYVAISSMQTIRFGQNRGPFDLQFGAEVAWNNFMFNDELTIRKNDGTTRFIGVVENDPRFIPSDIDLSITGGTSTRKSKFVTATLGVPLMFGVRMSDDLKISAGGYVNYKLMSWSKVVYYADGKKRRTKNYSDYNLNDWRYGLMATFTYKGFSVFGKYDLSPLFSDSPTLGTEQSGDFTVYSFGIRI